jgi:hypothetical protein
MEYVKVDREKVRKVLKASKSTETKLCASLGIAHSTYWRRFEAAHWTREQVIALTVVLSTIAGAEIAERDIVS